jgi:hypothetical protein
MKGEVIGGGWLVLARNRQTGRYKIWEPLFPPLEFGEAADAVKAAQRLADTYPNRAFCVLKQQLEIIIQNSATPADTAAGGSGLSPDEAVAGTPMPQLAAAAEDNNGGNRNG